VQPDGGLATSVMQVVKVNVLLPAPTAREPKSAQFSTVIVWKLAAMAVNPGVPSLTVTIVTKYRLDVFCRKTTPFGSPSTRIRQRELLITLYGDEPSLNITIALRS